jgi:TRAP-type mannitol/chloroaromatic compound transport system substrate-binding protein
MKRRDFLKVTGLGVAGSATIAAPALAQSMPEIKWRMPTSWPKSLDTLYGGAEVMCKLVAEATDNKFQIQIFAAGEIVPGLQVFDAVQNATCEIGHTTSARIRRSPSAPPCRLVPTCGSTRLGT